MPIFEYKVGRMVIKKFIILIVVNAIVTMITISSAYALRCGGRIVSVGDTPMQVVDKCGQPDHIETRQETRHIKNYHYHKHNGSKGWHKPPYFVTETIQIEEWIYNFGPTRFMRHLIFMTGRLEKIEIGDKGYYR